MSYPPQPYPTPGYPAQPGFIPVNPYASWFSRVGSYLVDQICHGLAWIPAAIGAVLLFAGADTTTHTDPDGTVVVDDFTMTTASWIGVAIVAAGVLFAIGFAIWNVCIRQGRTGSSLGKSAMGTRLVKRADGQTLGGGLCFLRQLLHFLDGLVCYLGYLWPLWDPTRQTFADKIVNSVVIKER